MESQLKLPVVISNSPHPFIVTAQVDGKDVVVIRTIDAPLDLLGVVSGGSSITGAITGSNTLSQDLFFGASRQLNVVAGYPVSDLLINSDTRTSSMKFAWVGECSDFRRERVLESFRSASAEILRSLKSQDSAGIEWALGEVLLQCSIAGQRKADRRRLFITFLIIYTIAALFGISYVLARNMLRQW
jgi:hypothetical protein